MKGIKPMNLKNKTIAQAKEEIAKLEKKRFYQCYVVMIENINRNTFKMNKRVHEHNKQGERIYHQYEITNRVYADDQEKEESNIVIDSYIELGKHSYFGFEGFGNGGEGTHNIYYLVVEHLQRGNKGTKEHLKCIKTDIAYKPNELTKKDRRIIL